jgi:pimeloyl-ACP methyl ester carboxylesterase
VSAPPSGIRREYVTIGTRQVHVRHAGRGDPVVLVHQSPTSARTLDAQTTAYAEAGFHAIAVDIPGLGRSDPLGLPQPEIADLAIGLAEFLDAVGVNRTALYGSHTGALICAQLAVDAPERVSAILVDGYPAYTPGERDRRVATYFPPYEVSWDGAHLVWLWHRYREQYLFWPWNVPGESTRARCDVPDPVFLHEGVVDMLRVGNEYRRPYSAAFRCRSDELLRKVSVPTYFLAYPDDSLTQALALLGRLPDACRVEQMPDDRAAGIAHEIALLRRHPAGACHARFTTASRPAGITRGYVDSGGAQLALRSCGSGTARPLVVLPPAPGSGAAIAADLEAFARHRPVIAIDVPGCGDSDPVPTMDAPGMAAPIAAALDALGVAPYDLYALHGGCNIAACVAGLQKGKVRRMFLESPVGGYPADAAFAAAYAPPIVPDWAGSHLLKLWHAVRNRRLFRPWFDQRLANRTTDHAAIEAEAVDRDVLAALESWRTYHAAWHAVLQSPVAPGQAGGADAAFGSRRCDEFAAAAHAAAAEGPVWLPDAVWARADRILAALE